MVKRGPTKSGFSESVGIGYSLQAIADPGRGRRDNSDLIWAIGNLEAIDDEVSRISDWSDSQKLNSLPEISHCRDAIKTCRVVLENFRTQKTAKEAAAQVVTAYERIWRRIEKH